MFENGYTTTYIQAPRKNSETITNSSEDFQRIGRQTYSSPEAMGAFHTLVDMVAGVP